jgi:3-hydroxy-9,10-secoandrosta-1,3,5(10)-triene-9,17-dione monooxygenase reductase component
MLVLFCPGKRTRFAQALPDLGSFSINFLRHEQQALSTYFAGGWEEPVPPPFRFVPSRNSLRLEGSLASIGGELAQVVDAGDHWLVMGRVCEVHTGVLPHRPLLFFGGRYRSMDFSESAPAPELTYADDPTRVFYDRWDHR